MRVRRQLSPVVVSLLALVLASCSASEEPVVATASSTPQAKSTTSTTEASPTTTSTPGPQAPCAPADLRGTVQTISNRLSSGNGYAWVVVANTSASSCNVQGSPGIEFLDETGEVLPFETEEGNYETVDLPVGEEPVTLAPGLDAGEEDVGKAALLLTWRSPNGGHCSRPTPPSQLRITINGGVVTVPVRATAYEQEDDPFITPCGEMVAVRPFQPGDSPGYG